MSERHVTPFFEYESDDSVIHLYSPVWVHDPFFVTLGNALRHRSIPSILMVLLSIAMIFFTVWGAVHNSLYLLIGLPLYTTSLIVFLTREFRRERARYRGLDSYYPKWDKFMLIGGKLPRHWGSMWRKELGKDSGFIVEKQFKSAYTSLVEFGGSSGEDAFRTLSHEALHIRLKITSQMASMKIKNKSYPAVFLLLMNGVESETVERLEQFSVDMYAAVRARIDGQPLNRLFEVNEFDIDPSILDILNYDLIGLVSR